MQRLLVLLCKHAIREHAGGVHQTTQPRELTLAHLRKDVTPIRDIAHIATCAKPLHATLLQLLHF